MRAVNLIPAESRGRSRGPSTGMALPMYVLLGLLAAAVALVTVYVLTGNSISSRQATLTSLKTQVSQEQAIANRLGSFSKFSQLAQTRVSTVSSIAAARFDWHDALENLAKVVPANTTLSAINGTVVPGAGAGGSAGNALRSDITAPAFELTGCTDTQDDVARLMSRLRLINGVTRVSFSNSQEAERRRAESGRIVRRVAERVRGDRADVRPDRVLHARGQRRRPGRHLRQRNHFHHVGHPRHHVGHPCHHVGHHDHDRRHPVTTRDRIVILIVLALGSVVAGWMFVVSPKRDQATKLSTQITAEQSQLSAAQGQVAAGESAKKAFAGQYAQLAKLGEAVPPDDDIPSLIYQVQSAAQETHVSFRGLQLSAGSSSATTDPDPGPEHRQLVHDRCGLDGADSPGSGGRRSRPADRAVHDHAQRQLLPPVVLLQPSGELRGQQQQPPACQRAPDDDQRDQPRARPERIPADHRERVGDDLHRPADRRSARRSDAGWTRAEHPGAGLDFRIVHRRARRGRHPGAPMTVVRNMLKELVERKLWPVALVLIVALVAVPVLLTKKAPTDLVTPPTGPLPYSSGTTLPAISVKSTPGNTKLAGERPQPVRAPARRHDVHDDRRHDGFGDDRGHRYGRRERRPAARRRSTPVAERTPTAPAPTTPVTSPAPARRRPRPRRAPRRPRRPGSPRPSPTTSRSRSPTRSGSLNTIDPLQRLSILPGKQQPMLVELGVLQGGRRVLFVVEPGTVVSGAGTCTPGPIDCEILSLAPGQTEGLSKQGATGVDSRRTVLGELDHGRSAPVGCRREHGSSRPRRMSAASCSRTRRSAPSPCSSTTRASAPSSTSAISPLEVADMRRYSLTARRMLLALFCTLVASLAVVASAQAVVVTDSGTEAGVSIVPDARGAMRCPPASPP